MNFILLNSELEQIHILDDYQSILWIDRFFESGECEIYAPASTKMLQILTTTNPLYLWNSESNHLMLIDHYEIQTTYDDGNKLLISGHSLEYILERRIIWTRTKFDGKFQDGIEKLLNENVTNPSDPNRKIPRMYFKRSTDPRILSMTTSFDFFGENLYDSITELCKRHKVGLRILLDSNDQFCIELYLGENRAYEQIENPYVIFSPSFENLGASNFIYSSENYKNVTLVLGERDENDVPVRQFELNPYNVTGLERREMRSEPAALDKDDSYLIQEGQRDLYDKRLKELFEGEIESSNMYVYGKDFFIGDIVQIENEYGMTSESRVIELVINQDKNSTSVYPTFESLS